jgi:hypothetical protein
MRLRRQATAKSQTLRRYIAARVPFTTTGRPERFFTKLEQTHARNFLKDAVEHVLLANPKPCVKHLLNTCLFKNL